MILDATSLKTGAGDTDLPPAHARLELTLDQFAALGEAFSQSDLPYKTDIVDWQAVDGRFRRSIANERVPLSGDTQSAGRAGAGKPAA